MSESIPEPRTPWHLWVLGVILLLWNGIGVVSFLATQMRFEPILSGYPEDMLAYYFEAPLWMHIMWGGSIMGGFLSAALLVMRRKLAIHVFVIAWLCSVAVAVYTYFNPPPMGGGIGFHILVLAGTLLVLFYMLWMSRRGVLR